MTDWKDKNSLKAVIGIIKRQLELYTWLDENDRQALEKKLKQTEAELKNLDK